MTAIAAHLAGAYPKVSFKHGVNVTPLPGVIAGNVRPTLLVLLGFVLRAGHRVSQRCEPAAGALHGLDGAVCA
jgi:hypothetical protein